MGFFGFVFLCNCMFALQIFNFCCCVLSLFSAGKRLESPVAQICIPIAISYIHMAEIVVL